MAGLASLVDLAGDLMAHEGVEVLVGAAGHRLELCVPPRLPGHRLAGRHGRQLVDTGQIPTARQKALHQRAGESGQQVHAFVLFMKGMLSGNRRGSPWPVGHAVQAQE
jgi:hypothetical protein